MFSLFFGARVGCGWCGEAMHDVFFGERLATERGANLTHVDGMFSQAPGRCAPANRTHARCFVSFLVFVFVFVFDPPAANPNWYGADRACVFVLFCFVVFAWPVEPAARRPPSMRRSRAASRYASKLFGVELAKYGKYRADGAYVGVGAADDDEGRHVIEADGRDDDRANAAEAAAGAGGVMGFDVDGGTRWGGGARSLSGAATFHYTRSAENEWQTTLTRRRA